MVENGSKIPGVERAAILLLSLGEAPAAEVLKHMAPKEVQKIGAAIYQQQPPPPPPGGQEPPGKGGEEGTVEGEFREV